MDTERTVKNPYIQVVEDHLESGDPPETKAALDALVAKGRSPGEAKQLVATVVRDEMSEMMSAGREFDNAKYAAALKKLLATER
ncbi:hypothetical protein BWI17_04425 [Betaproteobacteria bacterium GR16-43]|nr:hypothetical protein BWI17_04425 [Betaproteobacteria bacterium GR16-43]